MLLDFFSTLLDSYFILVGLWLIVLIIVFVTLFNRKDIFLPVKIFWACIIFVAPVIGLIIYLAVELRKRK
ncbi:MAG TPA: hypothetical protein VIM07_01845 [Chitinophagaceae bacterium]